jgi:predicted TIM-barrel fold metal-dependent hydrolase
MAESEPSARAQSDTPPSLEELDIVCADAHVFELPDDYVDYIGPKYSGVKNLITADDLTLGSEDSKVTAPPLSTIFGAHIPTPTEGTMYEAESRTNSGDAKVAEMADFNIDYGIVTPTMLGFVNTASNPDFAVALSTAYNSWVLENVLDGYDNIYGAIQVSGHRPEIAAEEIDERAREDSFKAVQLPPAGLIPPLGDPKYDPILQACEDNDLPLTMHPQTLSQTFPVQDKWSETFPENNAIADPFNTMWHTTTAVLRGLPDRYDIDFVFQECGISHIPCLKWHLDDVYLENPETLSHLEKLPSEYIDDRFYWATQPLGHTAKNPDHMAKMVELAGPENIVYSSDLPHNQFDPPKEFYDRVKHHFDGDTLRAMMGGTSKEIFGL